MAGRHMNFVPKKQAFFVKKLVDHTKSTTPEYNTS